MTQEGLQKRVTAAARRIALWYAALAALWIYAAALLYALLRREFRVQERLAAEERAARVQLQNQLAMLQALHDSARGLAQSPDVDTLAAAIIHTCVETFGLRLAWVGCAEPDGRVRILAGFPPDSAYLRELNVRWDDTSEGSGPTGQAIRKRQPVILENIVGATDYQPWRAAALEAGYTCSAAFPLVSGERTIGALNLYCDRPGYFAPERLEFFQTYARLAGAALERARLYDELREAHDVLEERVAERTAALSEAAADLEAFAYSVSHDLRTPLRALQGFSRALLEDHAGQLDATARDYALRIERAAVRMDRLIQDILAYSRLKRADMKRVPVSLAQVVEDALRQLEGELRACGAEVTVMPPMPGVLGHEPTLVQVLINLLSNACKFVAPGVRPVIRLQAQQRDGRVRLWVADNGIGIAEAHRERIFRVFERLHGQDVYPGTGIGLAIVHKALQRMGGEAGVESRLQQGSRFWIELPAAEASA